MDAQTIQDIHVGYTLKNDPKIFFYHNKRNKIYTLGRNQKGYIWIMENDQNTKSRSFHKTINEPDKSFINYLSDFMSVIGMKYTSDILCSTRAKKFEYHINGIKQFINIPNLPLQSDHKWFGMDDLFCSIMKQGYTYNPETGMVFNDN